MTKKSKFRGLRLEFLNINLAPFDGYGFSVLKVFVSTAKVITSTRSRSFLSLNFYVNKQSEGLVYQLNINILFMSFTEKIVRIEPKKYCWYCDSRYCNKEYSRDDKCFCSQQCLDDYIDD